MITQDDIDAFTPIDTDVLREQALGGYNHGGSPAIDRTLITHAADEIDKLRKALEPFVYAYGKTCEAYGFDIGPHWTTANMVSQPYIKMADYVAAHAAVFGRAWSMPASPLDDLTFVATDNPVLTYVARTPMPEFEHYGNAPPPGEEVDPTDGMDG